LLDTISKITRAKWTGSVAQVVELEPALQAGIPEFTFHHQKRSKHVQARRRSSARNPICQALILEFPALQSSEKKFLLCKLSIIVCTLLSS
jgi:hypothetical protein